MLSLELHCSLAPQTNPSNGSPAACTSTFLDLIWLLSTTISRSRSLSTSSELPHSPIRPPGALSRYGAFVSSTRSFPSPLGPTREWWTSPGATASPPGSSGSPRALLGPSIASWCPRCAWTLSMRLFHRQYMRLRSSSDFSLPLELDAWGFAALACAGDTGASLIVRVRSCPVSPPRSTRFTALPHVLDVSAHPYASNAYLLPQTTFFSPQNALTCPR
ncbi:hypothetical protein OG21DRAFT_1488052 [Imleria badia]|nr:hypothetical protein OG21DRAFT_1488052 [Imleria badia]